MLQRVSIEGVKFPRLYIAENDVDVQTAREAGIPYVKWKWGMESLVKLLLRPTLEKLFPHIEWNLVLKTTKKVESIIIPTWSNGNSSVDENDRANSFDAEAMLQAQLEYDEKVDKLGHDWQIPDKDGMYTRNVDMPEETRYCTGGMEDPDYNLFHEDMLKIEDYVGDLSSSVDIDALQKLGLLPKFMGDIADCIKHNVSQSLRWTEGYTKKLGYPLGKFNGRGELPNLLIIDCSHSIPDGIAATMLSLADTMRGLCNAELIITSKRSGYYPVGAELPNPQTLRDYYGRSNERLEFMAILEDHIAGREFGHVISFGDYDYPGPVNNLSMANTKVHEVHHYHTTSKVETGYARWVKECCPDVVEHFDKTWCTVVRR